MQRRPACQTLSKALDIFFPCLQQNYYLTRKSTGFKSLQVNCWKINQVTSKCKKYFLNKTCKKRKSFTYSKQASYKISAQTDNFDFLDQMVQKGCFRCETEKVNATTGFYLFKSVSVPNLSLTWQFWLFEPNLPKNGISGLNRNRTPPLNSTYSN